MHPEGNHQGIGSFCFPNSDLVSYFSLRVFLTQFLNKLKQCAVKANFRFFAAKVFQFVSAYIFKTSELNILAK